MLFLPVVSDFFNVSEYFIFGQVRAFTVSIFLFALALTNVAEVMVVEVVAIEHVLIVKIEMHAEITMRMVTTLMSHQFVIIIQFLFE